MDNENERLAKVAYNAYCETTNWKSAITGAQLPEFEKCPEAVKKGWEASAKALKELLKVKWGL